METLFQQLSWGNEENHEKSQSGQPVSQPRFEPSISQIQAYSVTAVPSCSVLQLFTFMMPKNEAGLC
jgi:hypothetical protein